MDLDGTLIRGDMLWESVVRLLMKKPWMIFSVVVWIIRGKLELKCQVAERIHPGFEIPPLRSEVVDLVERARAAGRRTVLCTATHRSYAEPIASGLGCFDEVIATDRQLGNVSGGAKAAILRDRFGTATYEYVGDSSADLPVWADAGRAQVVNPSERLRRRIAAQGTKVDVVESPSPSASWVARKELRLHQWAKNVLIFLPLLSSHMVMDLSALGSAVIAFLSFSFLASSVYLWNDLHDLDADRIHPVKRNRPIAAGMMSIPVAVLLTGALIVVSVVLACVVGPLFVAVLLVYFIMTNLYSSFIKRKLMADVVMLALLYTIRVFAGCAVIHVFPTLWLAVLCVFIFLSLAVMKRCAELVNHRKSGKGRAYEIGDTTVLFSLGGSSAMVAVLVVALYINSPEVRLMYATPEILWAAIPVMVYWLGRIWIIASRGAMDDDPVVFALRDSASVASLIAIAVIGVAATFILI